MECELPAETISILVQQNLQPQEGDWVGEWVEKCKIEAGTTIRIPYDPDEIASLSETFPSKAPEEVIEEENSAKEVDAETDALENKYDAPANAVEADQEDTMPESTPEETEGITAYEAQPSADPLTQQFGDLTQATGADPTLTIALALLAVVGGGAAWKFYRQYSEQKHEQKMTQMKLEAKAKGMEGQPPGPCQTVHAQLKAEVEELKSRMEKMDRKLSLNADFDGDDIERKVRRLEKWRKSLEEDEDE